MSQIENALGHLWHALERLEKTADQQEQKFIKFKQQELFNAQANGPDGFMVSVDPALLAKKLDIAITKVEQVLGEGEAGHG